MSLRNALWLVCGALVAPALAAQPVVVLPQFQQSTAARFDLSPAGARALGLGGAFVAVADDPTAADLNPAGLARLDRPELLVSVRSASLDTEFAGDFVVTDLTSSETVRGPAFVGYAHPLGRTTVAAYYQEDARFESGMRVDVFEILFALPAILPFPRPDVDERRYEQKLETLGAGFGTRLSPVVSVGGTLRYQRLSVDWLNTLDVLFIPQPPPIDLPPFIGARTTMEAEDHDLTVSVGLLVQPEGRWTAGLSYQQGAGYRLPASTRPTGFNVPLLIVGYEVEVGLPDVINAGAAFRPHERWLVSAQLSHLTYSDLRVDPPFNLTEPSSVRPISPFGGDEPIDDGTRLHLGAELRLGPAERPVTLRGGLWTDPDHDGIRAIDGDETHATLGAGIRLRRGWVLDGAASFADTRSEGMLAVGYRF